MPLCMVALALAMPQASFGQGPTPAAAPSQAKVVVPDMVQITGLPKGVAIPANSGGFCLDLGCGDGKLAAEIAGKTKYYVFALAKDDKDCETARQTLDKAGFYGTRSTAVAGSLKTLPLPNGYGNLIVTGDYQETLDLKEVFRVLNPNGLAVIGGGKTDPTKLKAALDAAGIKDYVIHDNVAEFRGKMPAGVDEWTHFAHGPDNIQTSRETVIRPPFRTQWYLAQPSYDDKPVSHAAIGDGRLIYHCSRPGSQPDHYYAFDAFNGAVLWDRPAAKRSSNNYRYALVDGVFYGAEGIRLVAIDATTGQEKRQYRDPAAPDAYWWWIAVQDGTLYALGHIQTAPNTVFGTANLFCAFDVKTGETRWKHECKVPALAFSVALDSAGGLYYCTLQSPEDPKKQPGQGVAYCLDAKTGAERWHTDAGPISPKYTDAAVAGYVDGKYFLYSCQDAKGIYFAKSFDAKTGQLVREYPGVRSWGEGFPGPLDIINGKIYCNPRAGRDPYLCYDVATGEKLATPIDHLRARDNPGHASATALYSGGEGCCVQDLVAGKEWSAPFIRPSDFSSPYPAEGMLFHLPGVCHCPHMFGAPVGMAPAGPDWTPPEADKDMASRLVTGPAFDTVLTEDGKEEWTHYRGNPGHTGEAVTAARTPLKVGWERKLGGRLTPPSFGGGLAFVASREGSVWALDQKTGEIRWRFLCGAGLHVTPAFGRGRVLFGSDDGWVYCLEAKTGQLAWRFRAAPEERYINAEGQMNSLWPSTAGVVLDGTIAYCTAGFLAYDGGYLYSLDIKTGKTVWAKRIGGPEQLNGSPEGIMALAGETIVVPVFAGRLTSAYRKTDGERLEWFKGERWYWSFGSQAIADGDVWFYGGPRHGNDDWRAGHSAYGLMALKDGWPYGLVQRKSPPVIAPIDVAPVLGKQMLLGDGVGYDRKKYCETLQSAPDKAKADSTEWSADLWPDASQKTTGLALAGDVALAAGTSEVVAVEAKKDGKELGRVEVEGTILRNSLAATDGNVFVVTEEGSVVRLNP